MSEVWRGVMGEGLRETDALPEAFLKSSVGMKERTGLSREPAREAGSRVLCWAGRVFLGAVSR